MFVVRLDAFAGGGTRVLGLRAEALCWRRLLCSQEARFVVRVGSGILRRPTNSSCLKATLPVFVLSGVGYLLSPSPPLFSFNG